MSIVLQFIQLDILQTDKWLTPQFTIDSDQGLNEYFEEQGYQSMFTAINLGSTFIFSFMLLTLFLVYPLISMLGKRSTFLEKVEKYLREKLFWESSIRFVIQQFQPLLISALINLYSLQFDTAVTKLSTLLAISTLLILGLSLYKMLNLIHTQSPCSPLTDGLNTNSLIGRYWLPITLAKWSILITALVTLRNYPALQLMIIAILLVVSQVLMIVGRPQDSRVENMISLFNEGMASVYLYGQYTLSESMGRNEVKEEIGAVLLGMVIFTISVNVVKVLVQSMMMINWRKLKSVCFKKSQDKVIKLKPTITEQPLDQQSTVINATFEDAFSQPPLKAVSIAPANSIDKLQRLYQNHRQMRY
ncbi:hypothetical protein FGO68_gene16416 [Halteria grandinella]|uniref:TRP C-terminal domain-containing protein n=1 Tax=Halteria grandinella TaxID=5974 RepID=A0A8J8P395_HALGN|nr:hypothetical protein FGO68_gene16416 [Halteria grandinella]